MTVFTPSPPIQQDLICYQGADFLAIVPVVDSNNEPINITGASAIAQVRSFPGQAAILLYTFVSTGGNLSVNTSDNTLHLIAPSSVTKGWNWPKNHEALPYYDVFVTLSNGQVFEVQTGNFILYSSTTALS